jgi:hypothetical protein
VRDRLEIHGVGICFGSPKRPGAWYGPCSKGEMMQRPWKKQLAPETLSRPTLQGRSRPPTLAPLRELEG